MKFDKELLLGLVIGICVPVVGYAIIMMIFEWLTDAGLIAELGSSFSVIKRLRTMGVLAIAFNLIPFNIFKSKRKLRAMRGVLFATFIYAIIWIVRYWDSIII